MVEAGARPDRAPREPRDQFLELTGELGGRRDAAIDVCVAEGGASDRHPGFDAAVRFRQQEVEERR
jgi:hypothetical protein